MLLASAVHASLGEYVFLIVFIALPFLYVIVGAVRASDGKPRADHAARKAEKRHRYDRIHGGPH